MLIEEKTVDIEDLCDLRSTLDEDIDVLRNYPRDEDIDVLRGSPRKNHESILTEIEVKIDFTP